MITLLEVDYCNLADTNRKGVCTEACCISSKHHPLGKLWRLQRCRGNKPLGVGCLRTTILSQKPRNMQGQVWHAVWEAISVLREVGFHSTVLTRWQVTGKKYDSLIFCLSQKNEETMGLLYAIMAIEVERQDVSRRFLLLWHLLHKPIFHGHEFFERTCLFSPGSRRVISEENRKT